MNKQDMKEHGFNQATIYEKFQLFEEEIKEERKKYTSSDKFNEAILKSKKGKLSEICKGLFVGNIFLKNAVERNHPYLMAWSEEFVIIVPYGMIQSVIHVLAIPKIPIYNAVSLGLENILLMEKMQAALVKVVTDILDPKSIAHRLYMKQMEKAIDATDRSNIRVTQRDETFDTSKMDGATAVKMLSSRIEDYYEKIKSNMCVDEVVCTDLHLHNTNSVGQLHMHGWIAEPDMITDNGLKLRYKNTPLDRIINVLCNFRGSGIVKRRKINVVTKKAVE